MSNNEKVILIKGGSSKWYEQAIFIVKNNSAPAKIPVDLVEEAEKIINNYMNGRSNQTEPAKVYIGKPKRRKHNIDIIINLVMLLSCIALAVMLAAMIL